MTLVFGTDYVNLTFINFCCAKKEVAKVSKTISLGIFIYLDIAIHNENSGIAEIVLALVRNSGIWTPVRYNYLNVYDV